MTPASLPKNSVSESPWNSHRLVSLWEIMNIFKSWELARLLGELSKLQHHCLEIKGQTGGGTKTPHSVIKKSLARLRGIEKLCRETGFNAAMNKSGLTASHIEAAANLDVSALQCDLRNVEDVLLTELFTHRFLYVNPDRAKYLQVFASKEEPIFGSKVWGAFPAARFDIQEAGNCLAAECNTAAVFHLMRAVEWGLRALCVNLGFRKLRTRNKKTGKVTYIALGWTDWKIILDQLNERVATRISKTNRGPKKQLYQEFYLPALQDIEATKDAWRNHVMHTRREYTRNEAADTLDRVKRLMELLATRVQEV